MRLPYQIAVLAFILNNLGQLTNCENEKLPITSPVKLAEIMQDLKVFKNLLSPQQILKAGVKFAVQRFVKFPKEMSEVCSNDVKAILTELVNPKTWSNIMTNWPVRMLDSLGKPPSGLLTGNFFYLGSYQECLDVVAQLNATKTQFVGEYCLAKLHPTTLSSSLSNMTNGYGDISFNVGLCFPSTCSLQDKWHLLNYTLKYTKNYVRGEITKENCQKKIAQPMDTTTIVLICILSTYVMFVLAATFADLPSHLKSENADNAERSEIKGLGTRMFASFSAIRNLKAILETPKAGSDIRVIQGIRTVSIIWVIGGHTSMYVTKHYPWRNQADFYKIFDNFIVQPFMFTATYSVTSFFVISGFLLTNLFIQRSYDHRRSPNIFLYYVMRYLRLTAPLLLMVLFLAGPFYYLNNGPIWPTMYADNLKVCRRIGWMTILYVQNFAPSANSCLTTGWYLSTDTQLYVFAPIILYPLYKKPFLGLLLMGLLFAGTTIASMAKIILTGQETFFGRHTNYVQQHRYVDDLYRQAYYNAPSYIIGMCSGYLLVVIQKSRTILSKKVTIPCWICAISTLVVIVYGMFPYSKGTYDMSPLMHVVYGVFARQAWALAVSWVIIACALGYGGIVNWLLTRAPHVILGRLSYCAYLVHSPILQYYYYGQKDSLYFSLYNLITLYCAAIVVTIIVATLLSVLIEMPIANILKQYGKKHDKSDQGPMMRQLTFDPTHFKNTSEIQKLLIEDISQDESEKDKNKNGC